MVALPAVSEIISTTGNPCDGIHLLRMHSSVVFCRGIVQLTNQAACDTLGFHRNDLVGRNVNQIIPP
jgi:hypothetical protein